MMHLQAKNHMALLILAVILIAPWQMMGCASLCTKRLPLYRDTPEKPQPPGKMALLITDPNLAQAVISGFKSSGGQWAEEKPAYETDAYRLSLEALDGNTVYQGLCMDITPTYACEVRPGTREVRVRLDLFGPWGQEKKKETTKLALEPGKAYFLRPDWEALQNKNFILKADLLPEAYTLELRARVAGWERAHSKGRDLAE